MNCAASGIHRRPGEPLAEGSRRRENKQGEGFKLARNTVLLLSGRNTKLFGLGRNTVLLLSDRNKRLLRLGRNTVLLLSVRNTSYINQAKTQVT